MLKVALVCITKDNPHYIHEWIEYNLKLGFDKIILYMNDFDYTIDHPQVQQFGINGKGVQLNAYNHFIKNNKEFDYAAFFDDDEFLVLKKHNNIKDFIYEFDNPTGIGINWKMFGSNGIEERQSNSLIKQFTRSQEGVNKHIKVILNLHNKRHVMVNPHCSRVPVQDCYGHLITGPFNPRNLDDVAYIAHYWLKSLDDWYDRCKRGRADITNSNEKPGDWYKYKDDNNEVKNLDVYNFLYES